MAAELLLWIRNDARELQRVALEVARFGALHGLSEKDLFDVTLAVDEVVTNVICYAFDDDAEHDIEMRLRLEDGELMAQVEDDGGPFDPLSLPGAHRDPQGPIEDRRVGGLGIFLVRRAMDALEYRRAMGKNLLTMRKRVAARE